MYIFYCLKSYTLNRWQNRDVKGALVWSPGFLPVMGFLDTIQMEHSLSCENFLVSVTASREWEQKVYLEVAELYTIIKGTLYLLTCLR